MFLGNSTKNGITACQLDVKTPGKTRTSCILLFHLSICNAVKTFKCLQQIIHVPFSGGIGLGLIQSALARARKGRNQILTQMEEVLFLLKILHLHSTNCIFCL